MDISTRVITNVVVTNSGSVHFATETEIEMAKLASLDDMIQFDGSLVKGSAIAEIFTLREWEETHPKVAAREYKDVHTLMVEQGLTEKPITPQGIINKSSKRGLQEMMKGFLKHGKASHPLYKAMQARLDGKPTSETKEYNPKYVGQKGWDQAKADGVF